MGQEEASDRKGTWKLPRGAHKLPRDVVAYNQRLRLVAGVARALTQHGYASLSVEHVVEQAGVSRSTFYENFGNKHDCVLKAHEMVFGWLAEEIAKACASESDWPSKVTTAVGAAIAFVSDAPDEARLLSLDVVGADPTVAKRVIASNESLAEMLKVGREECPQAEALPDLVEMALISSTSSLINAFALEGRLDRLDELKPQLVQLLLMPYLGVEEAQRLALAA